MRATIAVLLSLLASGACSSPPSYGLLEGEPDAQQQHRLLQAGVRELSRGMMTELASVSTTLVLEAEDPVVRRNALVFNLRSGDEAGRALFHSDPVICALDLLTLSLQLQQWVGENGDGGDLFGEAQPRVRESLDNMAREVTAKLEGAEIAILREQGIQQARLWAEENPLRGHLMQRVSIGPLLAGLGRTSGRSVFAVTNSVQESMRSIDTRLEVIGNRLPTEAVLQAALVTEAYLERLDVPGLLARADDALEQLGDLAALVRREREATLAEIDRQRADSLAWLARQQRSFEELVARERAETLARADSMREATLADLDRQRKELLADLDGLHARTLSELDRQTSELADRLEQTLSLSLGRPLDEQRVETLATAGALTRETVDEGLRGARELVDAVFLRALVLALIAATALVLAAALLRRRAA